MTCTYIVMHIFLLLQSIRDFAHSSFQYALQKGWPLYMRSGYCTVTYMYMYMYMYIAQFCTHKMVQCSSRGEYSDIQSIVHNQHTESNGLWTTYTDDIVNWPQIWGT